MGVDASTWATLLVAGTPVIFAASVALGYWCADRYERPGATRRVTTRRRTLIAASHASYVQPPCVAPWRLSGKQPRGLGSGWAIAWKTRQAVDGAHLTQFPR
jgi:hypothetical protein